MFARLFIGSFFFVPPLVAVGQVELSWPVDAMLNRDVILHMHVDTDRNPNSMSDYRCGGQYVYDGHRGTDITALSFRHSDHGIAVLAAADGVVSWTRDGGFDRNYWPPYEGEPNAVIVQHGPDANSQYWHLRTNSVAVSEGEAVATGQILGLIGSSGQSAVPHLHFEVWTRRSGAMTFHDPFAGGCSDGPGLWREAYPYPGDTELRVLDMDIMLDKQLQGTESNNYFGELSLKDRPFRPLVVSNEEAKVGMWVLLQGDEGAVYELSLIRPDGSVFDVESKTVAFKRGIQWHAFSWWWGNVLVKESDRGSWIMRLEHEGIVLKEVEFEVGESTEMPIRFYPVSGRSIKLDGADQTDILSTRFAEGDVEFELLNAPSVVALEGNEIRIPASAGLSQRNHFFEVVARDDRSLTDTMRYHLVDLAAPVVVSTTNATDLPDQTALSVSVAPNPFIGSTQIFYTTGSSGPVSIDVFDVLGRHIQNLAVETNPASAGRVAFEAADLPAGMYVVKVSAPTGTATETLIRLRTGL